MVSPGYLSPHDFTDWISKQIRRGFGLVPFIGSGMSAASGILTAQEFRDLLAWTMFRCVANQADRPRLDLCAKGWPSPPRADEVNEAIEWIEKVYARVCEESKQSASSRIEAAIFRPAKPEILPLESKQVHLEFAKLLKRLGMLRNYPFSPDVSTTSQAYIEEAAIRSLHS